jgi:hypothetical protein
VSVQTSISEKWSYSQGMAPDLPVERPTRIGRFRRWLSQPWIMATWTEPLGRLDGLLFRNLTAKGVILSRVRPTGEIRDRAAGLSLEHRDQEDRFLGQAYLELREAELLISLLDSKYVFSGRHIDPAIVAVQVHTRDGLTFGWFQDERGWAIELRLRTDIAFALPLENAGDLRSFLQTAVDALRKN